MPLNALDFDKVSTKSSGSKLGRNQVLIIELLKDGLDKAYTQREIKKLTGIEYDAAVNTSLHSLKVRKLVACKRVDGFIYWRGTNGLLKIDTKDTGSTDERETDDEDRVSEKVKE